MLGGGGGGGDGREGRGGSRVIVAISDFEMGAKKAEGSFLEWLWVLLRQSGPFYAPISSSYRTALKVTRHEAG